MTASPNEIAAAFNGTDFSNIRLLIQKAINTPEQANILAQNPNVVLALEHLSRSDDRNERCAAVRILATSGFINALPKGSEEQILHIIEDESLPAEQRAAILAADMAIWRLSGYMQGAKRVAALLTNEQKVSNKAPAILLAHGAVWGLALAGQGEAVMAIIENAPTQEHKNAILDTIWVRGALETAGFGERVAAVQGDIVQGAPTLNALN